LSASLLFALSGELLKWQFPAYAAGEKFSALLAALAFSKTFILRRTVQQCQS